MTLIPERRRRNPIFITALTVGVAAAVVITLALTRHDAKPAGPDAPSIANIKRPNVACTPVTDKKIGLGDNPNDYLWFGWLDGKQTEAPYGQVLAQRIAGHKVEDAWLCPPRSQW